MDEIFDEWERLKVDEVESGKVDPTKRMVWGGQGGCNRIASSSSGAEELDGLGEVIGCGSGG